MTEKDVHLILMEGNKEQIEGILQSPDTVRSYEEYAKQTLIGMILLYPDEFPNRKFIFDMMVRYGVQYEKILSARGEKKSSISWACYKKDLEMTKLLLEAGVDANQNSDSDCPLNQIIFFQHSTLEEKKAFLDLLFHHGASLNIHYRNKPLLDHLLTYDSSREKNALSLLVSCVPYFSEENKKLWKPIRLQSLFIKTKII